MDGRHIIMDVIVRPTLIPLDDREFGETADRGNFGLPGPQMKRRLEKGGKLNTSQAGSVAASRAAVGQFLSISCEAFILRTR